MKTIVFLVSLSLIVGCATPMRINTHTDAAEIYVNGVPKGKGDITLSEEIGYSRTYFIEARHNDCKEQTTIPAIHSESRAFGIALIDGMAGGIGGAIGASAGGGEVSRGILLGAGLGLIIGTVHGMLWGYEAPAYVDIDSRKCLKK
jgi:hypothetical protein